MSIPVPHFSIDFRRKFDYNISTKRTLRQAVDSMHEFLKTETATMGQWRFQRFLFRNFPVDFRRKFDYNINTKRTLRQAVDSMHEFLKTETATMGQWRFQRFLITIVTVKLSN